MGSKSGSAVYAENAASEAAQGEPTTPVATTSKGKEGTTPSTPQGSPSKPTVVETIGPVEEPATVPV